MPSEPLNVCVFCASSEDVDPRYRVLAAATGRALAERGWRLVYGGGNIGLMGEVARAALSHGAEVTGIIPERLALREIALTEVTELIRTQTLRERQALMDDRSDAFLALPGGLGTLEELIEILTLKQLGFHDRAIVVLDPDGFWAPLLQQLARIVDQRLAQPSLLGLLTVVEEVDAALDAIAAYRPGPPAPVPPEVELEAMDAPAVTEPA